MGCCDEPYPPAQNAGERHQLSLSIIDEGSPLLEAVIQLGDKNRRFVGFFPHEAFIRNAQEGRIIGALLGDDKLVGYILYYVARGRAVIQQLCVNEEHRNAGTGRELVRWLKEATKHLEGIHVHCRRDFPSHDFWPQVGFVALGEKLGRGKKAETLTRYWFDHGHENLFSTPVKSGKITAVLDANVFYDFVDDLSTGKEAQCLRADWLSEHVDFAVTEELLNEINRQGNPDRRRRSRGRAQRMQITRVDRIRVEELSR